MSTYTSVHSKFHKKNNRPSYQALRFLVFQMCPSIMSPWRVSYMYCLVYLDIYLYSCYLQWRNLGFVSCDCTSFLIHCKLILHSVTQSVTCTWSHVIVIFHDNTVTLHNNLCSQKAPLLCHKNITTHLWIYARNLTANLLLLLYQNVSTWCFWFSTQYNVLFFTLQ